MQKGLNPRQNEVSICVAPRVLWETERCNYKFAVTVLSWQLLARTTWRQTRVQSRERQFSQGLPAAGGSCPALPHGWCPSLPTPDFKDYFTPILLHSHSHTTDLSLEPLQCKSRAPFRQYLKEELGLSKRRVGVQ